MIFEPFWLDSLLFLLLKKPPLYSLGSLVVYLQWLELSFNIQWFTQLLFSFKSIVLLFCPKKFTSTMWPIPHLMNVWAFLSMGKPPKTMACLHNSRSFILWVPSAPHSSIWVWTKTDNAPYILCILFRHTLILLAICCITSHHIPLIPYEYPMIHLIVFHDCWFYMSVLMVKIRHFTNFLSFVFFLRVSYTTIDNIPPCPICN